MNGTEFTAELTRFDRRWVQIEIGERGGAEALVAWLSGELTVCDMGPEHEWVVMKVDETAEILVNGGRLTAVEVGPHRLIIGQESIALTVLQDGDPWVA